jgi:hypothetical protein
MKKSQENVMQEDFQQVTLIITNKSAYAVYNVSRNRIRPRLKRQLQSILRRLRQQQLVCDARAD